MSNQQNRKGNSGVNPLAVAAAVGLGALAAAGGYLFGRYQESCEAEEAAKVTQSQRRAPPTAPTVHQRQPPTRVSSQSQEDNDLVKPEKRDRECVICFRGFDDLMNSDEELHTTPCGHIFCYKCIRKALEERGRCPICRERVDPEHTLRIYL
jgi:hypothetical protein